MKILVVANGYPNPQKPYAANHIRRHVLLQQKEGLQFSILAPIDSRRGAFRTFWKYIALLPKIIRHYISGDYDLVHAHWPIPAGLIGLFLSSRGKPFVLTSHGVFVDDYDSRPWLIRRLVKYVLQNADVIIAVGKQHLRNIKTITDRKDDAIHLISMGVWIPGEILAQGDARKELNLPFAGKIIVFLGNLEREKGLDILLRAVNLLISEGKPIKLYVGGKGSQEENILKMIEEYSLEETVEMVGVIKPDDVFSWLSAADICAVPSRRESFGLVAVEAMTAGTVVVGANVGGLSETIKHGENGYLFRQEDYVGLAKQLRYVLENEEAQQPILECGRKTAGIYDMKNQARKVMEVYNLVLAGRK